jgi:hypothetical protein
MRTLGYRTSNDEAVMVSDEDWGQHCYTIGKTGVGKTSWLESLMAQDLAQGRAFCFIDKHGGQMRAMFALSSALRMVRLQPLNAHSRSRDRVARRTSTRSR